MKENDKKDSMAALSVFSATRAIDSLELVRGSLETYREFDPERDYTPKELEPWDALSDRFVRAVETAIKFFRTWEFYQFAENSDTFRDLLHRMEKLELITDAELWIEMREFRNRIVHDYLPEKVAEIYRLIVGPYALELMSLLKKNRHILEGKSE